jgi:glycosyltransferase involved in cell wall biosynthesis
MSSRIPVYYRAPVIDGTGYSETARNLLLGLIDTGKFDIELDNFDSSMTRADIKPEDFEKIKAVAANKIDKEKGVSVQSILAVEWRKFCRKNIGYGVFETDRIPKAWVPFCNDMDAIISPSEFNKGIFQAREDLKTPVYVVENGITDSFNINAKPIDDFKDKFNVVTVGLLQNRKGFDVVLNAFMHSFKNTSDARLIIKIYTDSQEEIKALKNFISEMRRHHQAQVPEVIIIGSFLKNDVMAQLFKSADLFVTATRGEAWGHAAPQAAACGAPVAVTGWSAPAEVLPANVAYHIDYKLIPLPRGSVRHPSFDLADQDGDHHWADPDPQSLSDIMVQAYQLRDSNRELGIRGYNHVKDWTWKRAALKLAKVIEEVHNS